MIKRKSTYSPLVLILGFILLFSTLAQAQVPGVVSQYMHNGLPLNPAIAGSAGYFTGTLSHRTQWAGFDGAPRTNVLSMHAPVKGENFGLGTVAWLDQFGVSNAANISVMGTYRIRFRKNKLFFGLSGGVQQGQNNWNRVVTNELGDELFEGAQSVYFTPTLGAGVYFVGKRYYASLSAPILLDVVYNGGQSYTAAFDVATTPVYLNVGYQIPLNRRVSLRPSAMLTKDRFQNLFSDFNLMLDLNKQLQIGTSYRTNKSVIGLIRMEFMHQFIISYAYDHQFVGVGTYSNGSHELSLQFDLKRKVKAINTRFF